MKRPKLLSWQSFGVVLLASLIGLGMIYRWAMRPPSDDELICESKDVAGRFFVPYTKSATWSPNIRIEHSERDRWLVSGQTEVDTDSGKRALHAWTAVLERISIGRVECVEFHLDGRRVLKLDPEFLRSPNSMYHSGPKPRCSGR